MESKWQLILHEKCEDPYYEITNGPISLIANCGFVGEDDADEDNIFNRVKDELNISGIDFHSGNKLELKQHLEIQELKYKMDELVQENERLKELIERINNRAINGRPNDLGMGTKQAQMLAEIEDLITDVTESPKAGTPALKEGESNTPAPGEGKEVKNG